jgi:hypothetical protein
VAAFAFPLRRFDAAIASNNEKVPPDDRPRLGKIRPFETNHSLTLRIGDLVTADFSRASRL